MGASLKILIEKIFFVIGIRPVETKTKPETEATKDLVMI